MKDNPFTTIYNDPYDMAPVSSLSEIDKIFDAYEEDLDGFLTEVGSAAYLNLYDTVNFLLQTFLDETSSKYYIDSWSVRDDMGRLIAEGRYNIEVNHPLYLFLEDQIALWEEDDGQV